MRMQPEERRSRCILVGRSMISTDGDSITGAVYADDFVIFSNGDMQHRYWDLDCKPTHALY
jgi:hypothetical protein